MLEKTTIIFAIAGIVLLFLPSILLIIAAIKLPRFIKGSWSILVILGALLISITSLDFFYSILLRTFLESDKFILYTMYSGLIFKGLNYLALLFIAIGLLLLGKKAKLWKYGHA